LKRDKISPMSVFVISEEVQLVSHVFFPAPTKREELWAFVI